MGIDIPEKDIELKFIRGSGAEMRRSTRRRPPRSCATCPPTSLWPVKTERSETPEDKEMAFKSSGPEPAVKYGAQATGGGERGARGHQWR